MKRPRKKNSFKNIILNHVSNNIKEYAIISIMFIIGIVLGVIFINNVSGEQSIEISNYINNFITSLKENSQINKVSLLKSSIMENILLALLIWFVGSTVIGMPIIYGIIAFRGFCLSYAMSSAIATLGLRKWNNIYFIYNVITKYYIYSLYICTSS